MPSINETQPTEEDRIRNLIEEEVAPLRRGVVTDVTLNTPDNGLSNHEATVMSVNGEGVIGSNIPIIAPIPNLVSPPDPDADSMPHAIVEFLNGEDDRPIITGWAYTYENRAPEAEANDIKIEREGFEFELKGDGTTARIVSEDGSMGIELDFENGTFKLVDDNGWGIRATNDGDLHLHGSVKQHTSSTISL